MVFTKIMFHFKIMPFFILSFPVFVDIINGMIQGARSEGESMVGLLYRGGILLISIPYFLNFKYKRLLISILVLGIIVFLFHILSGGFSKNDLTQFVKMVYGLFFLSILLMHRHFKNKEVVCDCAIFYGFIAALSIIICKVLGIGYSSYTEGSFGFRGFFIAMNDVGLTMLMINALSLYLFLDSGKWKYFIFSLIIAAGCAMVGSMACYLGTIALYFAYVCCPVIVKRNKKLQVIAKRKTHFTFIVIICLGIFAASRIVSIIVDDAYLSTKYENVGATLVENGGRATLIKSGKKYLNTRPFIENVFGSGDKFLLGVSSIGGYEHKRPKSVESDFWDIYGCYGILMVVLIYWIPIGVMTHSMKQLIIRRNLLYYWIIVLTLIFLGHSYYGGHALSSPLSSSYYVIAVYLLECHRPRRSRSFPIQEIKR